MQTGTDIGGFRRENLAAIRRLYAAIKPPVLKAEVVDRFTEGRSSADVVLVSEEAEFDRRQSLVVIKVDDDDRIGAEAEAFPDFPSGMVRAAGAHATYLQFCHLTRGGSGDGRGAVRYEFFGLDDEISDIGQAFETASLEHWTSLVAALVSGLRDLYANTVKPSPAAQLDERPHMTYYLRRWEPDITFGDAATGYAVSPGVVRAELLPVEGWTSGGKRHAARSILDAANRPEGDELLLHQFVGIDGLTCEYVDERHSTAWFACPSTQLRVKVRALKALPELGARYDISGFPVSTRFSQLASGFVGREREWVADILGRSLSALMSEPDEVSLYARVHGDLHPGNILWDKGANLALIDYGISQACAPAQADIARLFGMLVRSREIGRRDLELVVGYTVNSGRLAAHPVAHKLRLLLFSAIEQCYRGNERSSRMARWKSLLRHIHAFAILAMKFEEHDEAETKAARRRMIELAGVLLDHGAFVGDRPDAAPPRRHMPMVTPWEPSARLEALAMARALVPMRTGALEGRCDPHALRAVKSALQAICEFVSLQFANHWSAGSAVRCGVLSFDGDLWKAADGQQFLGPQTPVFPLATFSPGRRDYESCRISGQYGFTFQAINAYLHTPEPGHLLLTSRPDEQPYFIPYRPVDAKQGSDVRDIISRLIVDAEGMPLGAFNIDTAAAGALPSRTEVLGLERHGWLEVAAQLAAHYLGVLRRIANGVETCFLVPLDDVDARRTWDDLKGGRRGYIYACVAWYRAGCPGPPPRPGAPEPKATLRELVMGPVLRSRIEAEMES